MRSIRDDQAVSESLGYVIIFGVIVACIALVLVTGSQIITDSERKSSFDGMKQSFDVLLSDLRKIAFEGNPVMTTKVNVGSGTLYAQNSSQSGRQLDIYYNSLQFPYRSPANIAPDYTMPLGAITYQSDIYGQSLSIEDGAKVEMYTGSGKYGSIMTSGPRIYYSPTTGTFLIDVINLNCTPESLAGGVGSIESRYENYTIATFKTDLPPYPSVTLCVKTPHVGAWDNYFLSKANDLLPDLTTDLATSAEGDTDHWSNVTISGVRKLVIVTYNVSVRLS